MNINNILNDKTFQVSFTASLVFLIVASPPLFKVMDSLLAKLLGNQIGNNYYIVLLIHAIIVGILMFLFTSYILKSVFKMFESKEIPKKKKSLENFSVGGKMTCGGK